MRRARTASFGIGPTFLLVVLLGPFRPTAALAACDGDCDGDGRIVIDEVVTLVNVALALLPPTACAARDAEVPVTIDELVRAVLHGLEGCPTASPSPSPATPSILTASPTASATSSATSEPNPSTSSTATRTVLPTETASPAPTPSPSLSATPAPSGTSTTSATPAATATATETWSSTPVPTATETPTATPSPTVTPSPTPTDSATPTSSATPTATHSASPTPGLGPRRFSLDPAASGLLLLPASTMVSGFSGYLDLAAGLPNPETGLARVDVVGASPFLSLALDTATRLCIRPIVPVVGAGVLACNGGFDLGIATVQDHRLGKVGEGGFTAQDCLAAGGTVESLADPHPNVCNGPVVVGGSGETDSGAGALLLAPDSRYQTAGLPAEVSIGSGPCEKRQGGTLTLFGFVSALARAEILAANAIPGASFQHAERGTAFSCENWRQENGPGRVVLSVPSLHAAELDEDLITVFILED